MAEPPVEVREHYECEIDEEQRLRQGPGLLELARTQEIVRRHLPAGPLRILDVGGGTGVHAAWLADDGHDVHLVDPIDRHVEAARRLAGPGRRITAEVGDARRLRADRDSADAVLLLGPLYHLTDRADRSLALREAARVVRPGGVVIAAGISRFASLLDGLGRGFLFDPEFRAVVERDLREGAHRNPERRPHWFTTAYFHHPDELRAEGVDAGFDGVEVLGVEGVAGRFGELFDRWDDPEVREAIMFSARAVESEPAVIGASAHLLMIARRPAG
ncbi:MAG TPA: class I SAM-dependent methyltransferase [Acidimicrobiales bacterium]|nr:class I SAM-dependent methyltransferase [Acidimicrobiales bacterium]